MTVVSRTWMKYRWCRRQPTPRAAPHIVQRSPLELPSHATHSPAYPLITQAPIRPPAHPPAHPPRPLAGPPAHPPRPLTRPAGPPQLMYKLRKELGETDFNKIFNNVKVKGFDIEY